MFLDCLGEIVAQRYVVPSSNVEFVNSKIDHPIKRGKGNSTRFRLNDGQCALSQEVEDGQSGTSHWNLDVNLNSYVRLSLGVVRLGLFYA